MWLILAFLSAFLLGFYDVFKKKSLRENAVIPVLLLNTMEPTAKGTTISNVQKPGKIRWNHPNLLQLIHILLTPALHALVE